jgi:hypothetical protein
MVSVEIIEQQISQLDNASFSKLRDWFVEFEQVRLGRQVDAELKLELLRNKLQAGENSPILADFDEDGFLAAMHKQHSL